MSQFLRRTFAVIDTTDTDEYRLEPSLAQDTGLKALSEPVPEWL
jgi:hypothetical protein